MTTSLFAANALFAPLQHLARGLARVFASPSPSRAAPATPAATHRPAPVNAPSGVPRRLRVVRVLEGSAAASTGRIVISGRMADVCAELERLAALEAAHAPGPGLPLRA